MSRPLDREVFVAQKLLRRLAGSAALALVLGLLAPVTPLRAEGGGGGRDFDINSIRRTGPVAGRPAVQPLPRGTPDRPAARQPARGFEGAQPARAMTPTGQGRPSVQTGGRPGLRERAATTRPEREPRYPGRGHGGGRGWGPAAVGIGAGLIGGLILDQARRQPVYDPYELEPPRRARRPVIIEDDEDDAPALRQPRRAARPPEPTAPRRAQRPPPPPAQTARPAPRQPPVIVPPAAERRFVAEEILFELAPNAQVDAVLRRHRATLIASRRFELAGVTIIRARLHEGRSARVALSGMAGDRQVASAQPNYLYALQQAAVPVEPKPEPTPALKPGLTLGPVSPPAGPSVASAPEMARPASDIAPPALPSIAPLASIAPKRELQPQYIVAKLHLEAAHLLARGEKIKIAVIDSGADISHPELAGVVAGSYDALGGEAQPHAHGTAMAGAILAQAQLQGVAPAARLLAARAFSGSATPGAANGTTFHILGSLDWAAGEGARVVNLSFAGPQDRLLSRALAGAKLKGMVAVAAAGNGGAKAAPGGETSATVLPRPAGPAPARPAHRHGRRRKSDRGPWPRDRPRFPSAACARPRYRGPAAFRAAAQPDPRHARPRSRYRTRRRSAPAVRPKARRRQAPRPRHNHRDWPRRRACHRRDRDGCR